jgi:hypothetical protein
MLEIALDKVAHVIVRSRGVTSPLDTSGADTTMDGDDRTPETALLDLPGDLTDQELRGFLSGLNEDELASLVALAWIGRETYAPEELDEAISVAKAEHNTNAIAYLMSLPLLPTYLADGLDALGVPLEDLENDVVACDTEERGPAYASGGEID